MRRIILALALAAATIAAARAQIWIMSPASQMSGKGHGGTPPVSCASTGIFNLSNVCNDIYFIGALK